MSITSDEVNYLIYRYLQESGFYHSAFVFNIESGVNKSKIKAAGVATGALVSFLQKGLQYQEIETHVGANGIEETRCKVPFSLCKKHECRIPSSASSSSAVQSSSSGSLASSSSSSGGLSSPAKTSTPRRRKTKDKEPTTSLSTISLSSAARDDDDYDDGVADDTAPLLIPNSKATVFRGHKSEVYICSWNPKIEGVIASGSGDSTARIWEMPGTDGSIRSPIVLKHSSTIAASSEADKSKDVTAIDWNREGTMLATGSYEGLARVWGLDGRLVHTLKKHDGPIFSLKWNQKGDLLLSGSVDKSAIVWDVRKGQVKQQYEFHAEPTLDVDWRDNTVFATCSTDKMIYVCEIGKTAPVRCMKGHQNEVNSVKWDPSGKFLASCSDDHTAKIWSIAKERHIFDFTEHKGEIYTIKWGPQPGAGNSSSVQLLASASFDKTIKLWEIEHGRCVNTLTKHTDPVYSVSFSPNGEYLASGSFDRSMHIWSVKDGSLVGTYQAEGGIFEVNWSNNNNHIAIADSNHSLSVIDVRYLARRV